VGVLLPGSPTGQYGEYLPSFEKGLLDLGYVQGRNLALEVRWAEGQTDRLDAWPLT
jgi:putative ABC transport system substrate-binding protein